MDLVHIKIQTKAKNSNKLCINDGTPAAKNSTILLDIGIFNCIHEATTYTQMYNEGIGIF